MGHHILVVLACGGLLSMPRKSAFSIVLSKEERTMLETQVRQYTSPYCDVIRAKIVLLAAEGLSNDVIAARLDTPRQIVSKWRKRFALARLNLGAADPPCFPSSVVVQVKALACELPHRLQLPLSRLSLSEIRREVITQGLVAEISGATLWRWLSADALRPWRHRSWIFPRDPDFAAKAGRILDLYDRIWQGRPLNAREFVISADEKSSMQARRRKQPTLAPAPGRSPRVEHEYFREGVSTYLAAWDVHRAKVFGGCEKKSGIAPVDRLIGEVMSREPYKSARRVFWIMDNCSAHRGQRAVDRLRSQWPNVLLVHTPVHASWLNQIEIYFSIVQRKVLTPNDFDSLSELEQRLLAFERRYEETASPFQWTFTRKDLDTLVAKIENKRFAPAA
jgi:DDE superfamily endonuclease/Homeodomain-like domain